jgi:transposase
MTPGQLYELNKNIARLHQKGKTTGEIAEATGAKTRKIQMVVKAYREGGAATLKPKQLGRPKGRGIKLSAEQSQEIRKIITDKAPEQLRLKGFLWDLKNISKRQASTSRTILPRFTKSSRNPA